MRLETEIENRRYLFPERNHQYLLPRTHFHYFLPNGLDLSAGISHFLVGIPQDNEIDIDRCRAEIRPHQQLTIYQRLGRVELSHRYRIEEMFFYKRAEADRSFRMRFRYRLQAVTQLSNYKAAHPLRLKAFNEIILNGGAGLNPFDQNHLYFALNSSISEKCDIELGYMNWYQLRNDGESFFNRHIVRFTVYHKIQLNH